MPCVSDYPSDLTVSQREYERLRNELDKVTRVACNVLTAIEGYYGKLDGALIPDALDLEITGETRKWWKDHQKADQARKEREQREVRTKASKAFAKVITQLRRDGVPEEVIAHAARNTKVTERVG